MSFDPTSYPYDTVVRISDTIGGGGLLGSGVLISPDEVLTATHVVYSSSFGLATNIVVSPGYTGTYAPFGTATGKYVHYYNIIDANDLISHSDSQYDFAVIQLDHPFSLGSMGIQSGFVGGAVNITGFPGSAGGRMVTSSQMVSVESDYSLIDSTSLGKGSSGGPVWVTGANGLPYVVGVVSSGTEGGSGYDGLINPAMFSQITSWLKADDASIALRGAHSQYIVADNNDSVYTRDAFANRDGTWTSLYTQTLTFTDGTGVFDSTGKTEEAARLYRAAFGRTPDLTGLKNVTAPINNGTLGLTDVAMYFVSSPEFTNRYGLLSNDGFVGQLYQNVLGRHGSAQEVNAWTDQINHGMSRGAVLVGFSDSFENKVGAISYCGDKDYGEAYRLYQAAFDRTPDTPGLRGWVTSLDSGMSLNAVAQAFVGSGEFINAYAGLDNSGFVNRLYQNVLHRTGEASGVSGWVGQLNTGVSQASVLLGFSDSLENRANTAATTHDSWVFLTT